MGRKKIFVYEKNFWQQLFSAQIGFYPKFVAAQLLIFNAF